MQIQVQDFSQIGTGPGEGAHLADHGQDGGERAVGRLEGDMEHRARVHDLVDGLQGVAACGGLEICITGQGLAALTLFLVSLDCAERLSRVLEVADRHLGQAAQGRSS